MNALMTRSPLSLCFILFSNSTLFWFYLYILLLAIIPLASAVQNITITAGNPAINYQPSEGVWNAIGDSSATNGAFRLARTQNGVATLTRSFRSMHFVAPLWPIPVQVQISVGDITQVIDLQDYTHDSSVAPPTGLSAATQPSQIRWSFHGADGERAVRVNAVDSRETGWVAVVDSLIFEVMEPGDPPVPASSSPASPTSGSLATGSDDTDTDPNSRGSFMTNAPGPSSTPSVADSGFPMAGTAGNHQENESAKRKAVIISSSVCASVLILLLGGAGMWCWKKGNRKRVVSRLDEGKWAIGRSLDGDCDEKGYMGRQDLEKAKLQFGALVHISTDAPKLLDTKGPSPTFLDSYSHPQGTPTSSDGASISTFSATSKGSMHEAMLGLGVMYGAGGGVGRRVKSVRSLGSAGHEHGSPSSSNSLLTAESSSFLLEESSQQSHLIRGVIRQAEMMHFQASSSHLRLDRSIECARASSVLAIPVFETPISSRDTSAAVTPSTEFGSVQWHEVVGGFPTPPNSAAIMGCEEFSSVDRETSAGDVDKPVDGRRDSCWSDSFPFPIPRMPLPGLPYPPKSAPATQSSFRFIPQHANSVARASPLAHDAIRSFDSLRYSESHQQPSTHIPPLPAVTRRRPLPALPTPKTSSSKSPLQSSSHYLITEEKGNENANTPMGECDALVPPHITCTSPSTDGLLTPPPSGRGSNFAVALGIAVGQEPNGGPYHSRSPFASSLDTLGRLEAQLYS